MIHRVHTFVQMVHTALWEWFGNVCLCAFMQYYLFIFFFFLKKQTNKNLNLTVKGSTQSDKQCLISRSLLLKI